jgi:hypothetical protein
MTMLRSAGFGRVQLTEQPIHETRGSFHGHR